MVFFPSRHGEKRADYLAFSVAVRGCQYRQLLSESVCHGGFRYSPRRHGHDIAALFACPAGFVVVKLPMHLRDWVLTIIADFDGDVVHLLAAMVTVPDKSIPFAGFAFTFEDNKPRILVDTRRVRHAAGTEKHLAGFDDRGLLLAFAVDIDEILHAAGLHSDLVAGINVEIFVLR